MTRKERVDILLVERGMAESRSKAQRLVMAGQVRVEGQVVQKPSSKVATGARIQITPSPRFVSRGGEKLAAAIDAFSFVVEGRICADVGASTGGFTDCLLQNGAQRVYAIDVGHGVLHWRIRNDPRVIVMERTNARELEALPQAIDLVTVDASFISLRLLFPAITGWLSGDADVITLIKPQFEAGRKAVGKRGVIRDMGVHRDVVEDVMGYAEEHQLYPKGLIRSPLIGPKGNVEFLLWCGQEKVGASKVDLLMQVFT